MTQFDTAANLTSTDPTLAAGELGIESDTGKAKIGDGVTAWTSLGYSFNVLIDPTAIKLRRDSAGDWTSNDPTLAAGELGVESDTELAKTGDGSTAWTSLPYRGTTPSIIIPTELQWGYTGSPSKATASGNPFLNYWNLSASTAMGVQMGYRFPADWRTFDLYLWTFTPAAGTGNVRWIIADRVVDVGTRTGAQVDQNTFSSTKTPSTSADQLERVQIWTGGTIDHSLDDQYRHLIAYRWASDASDTYNQALGLVAVEFVKAS